MHPDVYPKSSSVTWTPDSVLVSRELDPTEPMSEEILRMRLIEVHGWNPDRIERAVNAAQEHGYIRWVAFQGWCRGGRPR